MSADFLLTSLIIVASPGTGVLFAAYFSAHVIARPRVLTWMRRAFASAFVALGAKLALADR